MSKYGCLVMGPAGSGKTTFCSALITHLQNNRRSCFYVNLDPAAETFAHEPDLDIKDLISLEDVMEELSLGPNGGLIYCFEFLLENLDFITEALDPLTEEYLIIFDMPGQIELYTHIPILPTLVKHLTKVGALDINLCAAYLLEATFVVDKAKFFAGTLSAMSAMIMLEVPHLNIMSKMDLMKGHIEKRELKRFLDPDATLFDDESEDMDEECDDSKLPKDVDMVMGGMSFKKLNKAVARLIDSFGMVSYLKLNLEDEESIGGILSFIDDAIQFHEAQEPREPNDEIEMDYDAE
ncbi:P-loop containing nucleoside triphosphate hydrolase [Erysiphe pulchra]|uniref:GPN-loop GTPase 3 n=1 Tax=Erysiphe pulchra TaxID=225359 RepID=A0A2S4PW36_9PEZI|nr:P-loop containing nucleoside triphosphate hydrolase [Erysiphe pulchra]